MGQSRTKLFGNLAAVAAVAGDFPRRFFRKTSLKHQRPASCCSASAASPRNCADLHAPLMAATRRSLVFERGLAEESSWKISGHSRHRSEDFQRA